MALRCSICDQPDPQVFALSNSEKFPLCASDVGSFILAHAALGLSIFPISAISFIEKPSDVSLFEQRTQSMTQATMLLKRLLTEEKTQWITAAVQLTEMKVAAIAEVESGFDALRGKLNCLHNEFVEEIERVRLEFEEAKRKKPLFLSPIAAKILTASQHNVKIDIYKLAKLSSISKRTKTMVGGTVKFNSESIEQLLETGISVTTEGTGNKQKETLSVPQVNFEHYEPGRNCSHCRRKLTNANSVLVPGHEGCDFCLKCLEKTNNFRLLCPECKCGFAKDIKLALKRLIPKYFQRLEEREEMKKKQTEMLECANCQTEIDAATHLCLSGAPICLLCCQERVITDSLGKPAICPDCHRPFPPIVFDEFDKDLQNCYLCQKEVYLATVRHMCENGSHITVLCDSCATAHRVDNHCDRCRQPYEPLPRWGYERKPRD